MKNKNILILLALIAVTGATISQAVLAAPLGPPPGSNLPDANFNSVTTENLDATSIESETITSNAINVDGNLAVDLAIAIFKKGIQILNGGLSSITSTGSAGYFKNSTSNNEVNIAADGIAISALTAGARAVYAYNTTHKNSGELAGTSAGIMGTSDKVAGYGVYGGASAAGGIGVYGYGLTGISAAASSRFSGEALSATNNVNTVKLATPSVAVDAIGAIKNAGLSIAADGMLSNPNTATITNDLAGMTDCIVNKGGEPSGTNCDLPVKVDDNLFSKKMRADTLWSRILYTQEVTTNKLNVSSDLQLLHNLNVWGGDLEVESFGSDGGHIIAEKGVGEIYRKTGGWWPIIANNLSSVPDLSCDGINDRILSCSWYSDVATSFGIQNLTGNRTCQTYARNLFPNPYQGFVTIVCWNPGAATW